MRASLYRLRGGRPDVDTGDGVRPMTDREMLNKGWKVVGTVQGDEIVHAAPGHPPLEGWTVLKDGRSAPWAWTDLNTDSPDVADRVLHDVWERTVRRDGRDVRERKRSAKSPTDNNPTWTKVQSDLPPHQWAGDE